MLPTGGQEGELRVWELRSRELVSHLKQHGQRVPAVALYSDDSHAIRSVLALTALLSAAVLTQQVILTYVQCMVLLLKSYTGNIVNATEVC
jgi:cilia- and flagella-associated protein 52